MARESLTLLAKAAEKQVIAFGPQEVSMTCWAIGTLSGRAPQELLGLLPVLLRRVEGITLKPQQVATVVWAAAKLEPARRTALSSELGAVTREVLRVAPEFLAQELSNVVWATGALSTSPLLEALPVLVKEVAAKAGPRLGPQELRSIQDTDGH